MQEVVNYSQHNIILLDYLQHYSVCAFSAGKGVLGRSTVRI